MQYELKIPKERIAILIGKKGEVKRRIEKLTKTKLKIDSKEGDVIISGEDSLNCYIMQQIVRAIARGFNPEAAQLLLDEENCLEIIEMGNYIGKSKRKQKRLKGRVIGEEGKAKKMIGQITETEISVYGKTISIIGKISDVALARKAVIDLLAGARHGPIYNTLQKKKNELKVSGDQK
ncbi:RNA-processing protein [Candidatus Woesearchaeota archaeon]|nr:RNA-processing protein [Candidatus Woesearchaeota archaeon]